MNYPVPTVAVQCLGYETAIKININIPDTWAKEDMAGLKWFPGFMAPQKHL
jgi:hypothetical protein